jgi:hypothetical protein
MKVILELILSVRSFQPWCEAKDGAQLNCAESSKICYESSFVESALRGTRTVVTIASGSPKLFAVR